MSGGEATANQPGAAGSASDIAPESLPHTPEALAAHLQEVTEQNEPSPEVQASGGEATAENKKKRILGPKFAPRKARSSSPTAAPKVVSMATPPSKDAAQAGQEEEGEKEEPSRSINFEELRGKSGGGPQQQQAGQAPESDGEKNEVLKAIIVCLRSDLQEQRADFNAQRLEFRMTATRTDTLLDRITKELEAQRKENEQLKAEIVRGRSAQSMAAAAAAADKEDRD